MTLQGFIFKAADGSEAPFERVFPEIDAVEVVIEETGPGNEGLGLRVLKRRSIREMINCSNPNCLGKGFALGKVLRELVQKHHTEWSGKLSCTSREESGAACLNRFVVQIKIVFN